MLEISILRAENPSCMWGRIVQSEGPEENTAKYAQLQVEMNVFYQDVKLNVQKLEPTSVEEGQVCVVYCSAMRNWCRAIVETVNPKTDQTHATCFLVDHGTYVIVKPDEIRSAVQNFLRLPFWVRKFHLAGLHPTTLQVSFAGEKAELIPTTQWDKSATRYLHNLLQASSRAEAVLLETQADSTAIQLYLTIKNAKMCVNSELVAKKFAYYKEETAQNGAESQAMDRSPVFLTHDIFFPTTQ